jgi:small GTP-binding protein
MTHVDIECIVVGDTAVGKTTMVATLNDSHYCRIEPTIGVEYSAKELEVALPQNHGLKGAKLKVKVWDTAGQERYRALIGAYFRNKAIGFLVFDVTSIPSFRSCEHWFSELKRNGSSQMEIVLVGNKCEAKMEPRRAVKHAVARDWAKSKGIPYYEISARQNAGVKEMFETSLTRVCTKMDYHPLRRRVLTLDPRSRYVPVTNPSPGVTLTHVRKPSSSEWPCCTLM